MKLKYYINNGKKIYTLKENKQTSEAHYKFLKILSIK